jgi:hypothetical protein
VICQHVFVGMTLLAKSQAQAAGFEAPFFILLVPLLLAVTLQNIFTNPTRLKFSILAYFHEFGHVGSFLSWLKAHFDVASCPR